MKKAKIIFLLTVSLFITTNKAYSINFYDGIKAPDGIYYLTYFSYYTSDNYTDSSSDTINKDFGYTMAQEIFRVAWYNSGFVATALMPVGGATISYYDSSSFGIGDLTAGIGYFLPIPFIDIMPMAFVKFPTGRNSSGSAANMGTGQYDLRTMIFFNFMISKFSMDSVIKYYFRFKNSDTDIKPGNELHLQLATGYGIAKFIRIGPSLSWMKSENKTVNGNEETNSAKELLSLGGDLYIKILPAGFTFTFMRDIYSENSTKGNYFQFKTVLKF